MSVCMILCDSHGGDCVCVLSSDPQTECAHHSTLSLLTHFQYYAVFLCPVSGGCEEVCQPRRSHSKCLCLHFFIGIILKGVCHLDMLFCIHLHHIDLALTVKLECW